MGTGTIILLIVAAIIVFGIVIYNNLISSRNGYKNAFAQIDVQLTRRHDLIPNLIETAKAYMAHEKDTLEAVVQARTQAVNDLKSAKLDPSNSDTLSKLGSAESGLSSALGKLFALSENYPDLKANENMMQLAEEITTTENKVAFSRQSFNDSVMNYNNLRESFPNSIISNFFAFKEAGMLDIEDEAMRSVPKVEF